MRSATVPFGIQNSAAARALGRAAAVLALSCCGVAGADEGWSLAKRSDGISVYTRRVADSPLKAFKGEVEVATDVERVLAVLGDADTFPDWVPDTLACRLLESREGVRTLYIETHAPWPASNRDGVYRFTSARDAGGGAATVRVEALPDFVPRREGLVRIPRSDGRWSIEAMGSGVHVAYEIHADPGGWVPAWIANLTAVRMPYDTLRNLRRVLLSPSRAGAGCPASQPAE